MTAVGLFRPGEEWRTKDPYESGLKLEAEAERLHNEVGISIKRERSILSVIGKS